MLLLPPRGWKESVVVVNSRFTKGLMHLMVWGNNTTTIARSVVPKFYVGFYTGSLVAAEGGMPRKSLQEFLQSFKYYRYQGGSAVEPRQ